MRLGRDGLAGLICIAVSLVLLVQSFGLPQLPLTPVGPGFYPRIILVLLAAGGVALLVQDLTSGRRTAAAGGVAGLTQGARARVMAVFAIVGCYALLLPMLGFRIATALFVAALQPAIEWPRSARDWAIIAAAALATPVAVFFVFERYLLVLLPRGSLTGW